MEGRRRINVTECSVLPKNNNEMKSKSAYWGPTESIAVYLYRKVRSHNYITFGRFTTDHFDNSLGNFIVLKWLLQNG